MGKKIEGLKWETVPIEGFSITNDFNGFIALEECTNYGFESTTKKPQKRKLHKKKKLSIQTEFPKKKLKLNNGFIIQKCEGALPSPAHPEPDNNESGNNVFLEKPSAHMEAWSQFQIPEVIVKAIAEQGFMKPTKIQEATLPAALLGRRDILGAAETGSGKTLAFGIPIIAGILKLKETESAGLDVYELPFKKSSVKKASNVREEKKKPLKKIHKKRTVDIEKSNDNGTDSEITKQIIITKDTNIKNKSLAEVNVSDEDDSDMYIHLSEMLDSDDLADSDEDTKNENSGTGCVNVLDGVELPSHVVIKTGKPLYALILTPTRELAMQISRHLNSAAKYTGLKLATIVGGMAQVKQERVLSRGPEIVVATPGRLWELIQQGQSHLQQVDNIKFLAIDETDRMVERNHFEELQPLLERLNSDEKLKCSRQNFVFSATLTLVHDLPNHMKTKKVTKRGKILNRKVQKMTSQQKIQRLISMIGMTAPKVVDITTQNFGTAESLTECRIACSMEQKDYYLYYILKRHPGRTIVFCNSIGCVKRLAQLLGLLQCRPLPLHASMAQRQRLKNLEKFSENPLGILVATDVAARGLDIPNVDHVIHYQVPRTAENYVHRSGRTARAEKEGLTILMMEPGEAYLYGKLCHTLGKKAELPTFPVPADVLAAMKETVTLAREVDKLKLSYTKATKEQGWLDKVAREMDIVVDEDFIPSKRLSDNKQIKTLQIKTKQLETLLGKPVFPKGFSFKYPTLNDPNALVPKCDENALQVMKTALKKGILKKEKRKSKNSPLLKLSKKISK